MSRAAIAIFIALAGACAPLRSDPLPPVGPAEYGVVEAARRLDLRAGETTWERGAWATLSGNPFVVGAAVLGVEDEFGRTQISEYDLSLSNGARTTVRSRYLVEPGQCVQLRRGEGAEYALIVRAAPAACESRAPSGGEQP